MGDHRPHIKIWMEFHGVERQMETTCNWSFESGAERIAEWVEGVIAEGMAVYDAEVEKLNEERTRSERERAERAELARLKAKYPDSL